MRALNDSEVKAIQSTLESITSNREIVALAAYGSQVAGYATKESDYDVVLVVKPFTQRIKYYYMKGETECSALVVDPKSFENDCKKSTLGEFVSGRLLNPYYQLQGNSISGIMKLPSRKEFSWKDYQKHTLRIQSFRQRLFFRSSIFFMKN